MKTCHHTIVINAPISKVWSILTDTDRFPTWNPLIKKIRGTLQENELVFAYVAPLKTYFPVRVIKFEHERALVWQGKAINAFLVMGEHYYYLKDLGNGQTELQHGEHFTGLLSNFMPPAILSQMQDAYEYHNQKLKVIAELGDII